MQIVPQHRDIHNCDPEVIIQENSDDRLVPDEPAGETAGGEQPVGGGEGGGEHHLNMVNEDDIFFLLSLCVSVFFCVCFEEGGGRRILF